MIADWIDAELRNWALWCRVDGEPWGPPRAVIASAEGRYISPSDLSEPPEPRPPAPNRHRAELVHEVYMTRLTTRERWVLIWRYVKPVEDVVARRRIRVNKREWEVALMAAARCVGEAFGEGAKWPS